ncbi:signal peptidase I [Nocardioides limicola]|uniref:signal peptidase I n=1 Tax=Nocardioides limicola TaxID=2803368 RepID=UPI0027DD5FA2|nr:signal peptidase I [Nocardioides sp. DJM-14]
MTTEDTDRKVGRKPSVPWWLETVLLVCFALGLAALIKATLLQAFYIPSESMEPGLVTNDRILVQKVSYWGSSEPERGDVVVFADPGGWLGSHQHLGPPNLLAEALSVIGLYPTGGHLVKRVIGVAGDRIACCDDEGRLLVNGVPLDEADYIREQRRCNGPMTGDCDWTVEEVPEGTVFVMGDNRSQSADSSVHLCAASRPNCDESEAFVPVDHVVGKVFALVWPLDRISLVKRPAVHDAAR